MLYVSSPVSFQLYKKQNGQKNTTPIVTSIGVVFDQSNKANKLFHYSNECKKNAAIVLKSSQQQTHAFDKIKAWPYDDYAYGKKAELQV